MKCLAQISWADEVAAQGAFEVLDLQVRDVGAGGVDAGVVHQDIHAAEGVERRLEHGLDVVLEAVVAVDDDRPAAVGLDLLTGGVGALLVVQVVHHDVGALAGELDRGGLPDAGVRPSDEGDLVLELTHVLPLLSILLVWILLA